MDFDGIGLAEPHQGRAHGVRPGLERIERLRSAWPPSRDVPPAYGKTRRDVLAAIGQYRRHRIALELAEFRSFNFRIEARAHGASAHVYGDDEVVAVGEHGVAGFDRDQFGLAEDADLRARAFDDLA